MRTKPRIRTSRSGTGVACLAAAFALAIAAPPASAVTQRDDGATAAAAASPSADEIVDKSIAARGGMSTWSKIDSLVWVGHIESERLGDQRVKFSLEEKRPHKTRFDVISDHPSVRIFDGSKGWKVQSRNDGMPDVQPYSDFEDQFAREEPGLGGPLITFRTQNRPIELLGKDQIEGHECYVLGVTSPSGGKQMIWVDAQTYLELRFDRASYSRDGKAGMVSVFYRDYKAQAGLQVPTVIQIGSGGAGRKPDRLIVERLAINPDINETRFTRPPAAPHSHEITIPATPPGGAQR